MKKSIKEATEVAKHIYEFLNNYAPTHLTGSQHTLKSYKTALFLFITFLETNMGIGCESLKIECFSRKNIEKWVKWLLSERKCSDDTANIRLASLRTFLKYLGSRDISYLYLYQEASIIPRKKSIGKN